MKRTITLSLAIIALLLSLSISAQIRVPERLPIDEPCIFDDFVDDCGNFVVVQFTGPGSVNKNEYHYYNVGVQGGIHFSTTYSVSGGTIVYQSKTRVRVRWTSVGNSRYIRANISTNSGNHTKYVYVNVLCPLPSNYSMTGGGSYCSGGSGVDIGLSGSQYGVNYTLKRGSSTVKVVAGTNNPIGFGKQKTAGTYTVVATNSSGCTRIISGSKTVFVNALPLVYNVTGGGNLCNAPGFSIGLSDSQRGVRYQLKRNGANVGNTVDGTGNTIYFSSQSTIGTYTVSASNILSGCSKTMNGNKSIYSSLPSAPTSPQVSSNECGPKELSYTLNPGQPTPFWQTSANGQSTANGVNYTAHSSGTYYVRYKSSQGCWGPSTAVSVAVKTVPQPYDVTGGGSYCSGGAGISIGLSDSQTGVNYQLKRNGSGVGSQIAGTGGSLNFGNQSTSGTYTVLATNTSGGCTKTMNGSRSITVSPIPHAFGMSGGGNYCSGESGVNIGLNDSQNGVRYQLKRGGTNVGTAKDGTGSSISFGFQTTTGSYTVVATYTSTGCSQTMSGSKTVTIDSKPTAYNVIGGGSYCGGGVGVNIDLSDSQTGINYQLKRDGSNVGSAISGTGNSLGFGNQTGAGTYTVAATNPSTGCIQTMSGSQTVTIDALPIAYNVTGGGSYCSGDAGVNIGLSDSQSGVNYQLKRDGSNVGSAISGTSNGINFGNQTVAGTYTVTATNPSTGCIQTMNGSQAVTIDALPIAYNVTGGGNYCSGDSGVNIGLSDSQSGVNYQLKRNGSNVGSLISGTNNGLDFGNQTAAGAYTIVATNASTGCIQTMTGSQAVTIDALPIAYNVTGGGSYCSGDGGVSIDLSDSQNGINYQLKRDGTNVGSVIGGTNNSLGFGNQTIAGAYTVVATNPSTGCVQTMSGSQAVTIDALPTAYNVTGGGSYCSGDSGVSIGLSNSQTGVNYQLKRDGANVGSAINGTNNGLEFGNQTGAGAYTVVATNSSTGCIQTMTGSKAVTIDTLPQAYNVTGGGNYCSGDAGATVGLDGSELGIDYQLSLDGSDMGTPITGTGGSLDFGNQTTAGDYSIVATNSSTSCSIGMNGIQSIIINTLPLAFSVTGGGTYCSDGTGQIIGLDGSEVDVEYQLLHDGFAVDTPSPGDGNPLNFGFKTAAGSYSVVATNSITECGQTMTGSTNIVISNPTTPSFSEVTYDFDGATIIRNNPQGAETWYWQTTSEGTSEGNPSSSVSISTSGTSVFLRAKTDEGCWGTSLAYNFIAYEPATIETNVSDTLSLLISWSDIFGNETGFEISRSTTIDGIYTVVHLALPSETSYVDSDIVDGETYFYRVRGVVGDQLSPSFQVVSITAVQRVFIPDNNFEQSLIDLGYDDVLDDYAKKLDVNQVTSLNVSNQAIIDLKGIEEFEQLKFFTFSDNAVSTLNLSGNTNLRNVTGMNNVLTSVLLPGTTQFPLSVNLIGNNFETLDVSNAASLKTLQIADNTQLTNLTLPGISSLEILMAYNTQLTNVNLSLSPKIRWLILQNTLVQDLDLTTNQLLEKIDLRHTLVQNIDFSENPILLDADLRYSAIKCISANQNQINSLPSLDWSMPAGTYVGLSCEQTYVPDDEFEKHLVDMGYDYGGPNPQVIGYQLDDYVYTEKIKNVNSLTMSNKSLTDLTGIEGFESLEVLDVSNNNLTSVVFSPNINLRELKCNHNSITSLDISNLTNLELLHAGSNQLVSLSTLGATKLEEVRFENNTLTSIDLSQNNSLKRLYGYGNYLQTIDLTQNLLIEELYFYNNQLNSIDLTNNSALQIVSLIQNGLNQLIGLEGLVSLNTLDVAGNDLSSLDVSNNTVLSSLDTRQNNLYCIIVSGDQLSSIPSEWKKDNLSEYTIDCSLIPRTYIPDDNFEQALISKGLDYLLDDYVNTEAIENQSFIDLSHRGISDLTGIEDFQNIWFLNLNGNPLLSVDLTLNASLETVDLQNTLTTSLSLPLTISSINAAGSNLEDVDLSTYSDLVYLNVSNNKVSSIDVGNNPLLKTLFISSNQLVQLDVSQNASLQNLDITSNSNLACVKVDSAQLANIPSLSWDEDDVSIYSLDCSPPPSARAPHEPEVVLSAEEELTSEISLYPNPASDYIKIAGNIKDGLVNVYDLNGKEVLRVQTGSSNSLSIDASSLKDGIYLIRILTQSDHIFEKKVVIRH